MGKVDLLGKMFCKTTCSNMVSECPMVREVPKTIAYCPKCEGRVDERDENGEPVKFFGGLIPVTREDSHYTWNYACDCEVGMIRRRQGVKPYEFHGDEICMLERTFRQLQMKWKRNNLKDRPSISHIQQHLIKILRDLKERESGGETPFD